MKFEAVVFFVVVGFAQTNARFFSSPRIEPHEEVSQACRNLASSGSCAFYDCLERRFPCGHDGFTIAVGKHFCTKIAAASGRLNAAGRVWVNGTSQCLTSRLMQVYESYASRCDDIREVGASSIAECKDRVEADGTYFCAVVHQNWDVYSDIFAASDIGRIIILRNPGMIDHLLVSGSRIGVTRVCGRAHMFSIDVENSFSSLQRRISSLFD